LPTIMDGMNDKSKDVVAAAKQATTAILLNMSPYAIDQASAASSARRTSLPSWTKCAHTSSISRIAS
jgi:hypothetical protein